MPAPIPHLPPHNAPAAPVERPLWQISRQQMDIQYPPGGDPIEIIVVYFVTRSGTESYVRIPRDTYSADVVARAVANMATLIEDVQRMRPTA